MQIEEIKKKITPILKAAGVRRAGIFGSYARGEQSEKSDIDILVELPNGLSLFDVAGIQIDLKEAIGKDVDLVQYDAIKPRIRDTILREEVTIM